jgi:hypothetical protein
MHIDKPCCVCGGIISSDYRAGRVGLHGHYMTKFCSDECWSKNREVRMESRCHICQHCGIAFQTRELASSQKYCSLFCRGLVTKGSASVTEKEYCKGCGTILEKLSYRRATGLCRGCYIDSRRVVRPEKIKPEVVLRYCSVCGVVLQSKQRRFCSIECAQRGHPSRPLVKANCEECGNEFTVKNKKRFCSKECAISYAKREYSSNGLCGKSKNRKNRKISKATRFAILERDGFRCRYCGDSPKTNPDCVLELDHVTPVCEGGTDEPSNLATACKRCNGGKAWFKVSLKVIGGRERRKKEVSDEHDKPKQEFLF